MAEDDLSFHGTQQSSLNNHQEEEEEVPGTQNPNFPTMASRMALAPPMAFAPIAARGGGTAMTVNQHGQASGTVPPVVHHPSFVNRGSGGSKSNDDAKMITTKITPRDKPRQLDGMEFGRSSSSSFSSSNIARGAADAASAPASNKANKDNSLMTNRQYPTVRGGLGGAPSNTFNTSTAAAAMSSSSSALRPSGKESTTTTTSTTAPPTTKTAKSTAVTQPSSTTTSNDKSAKDAIFATKPAMMMNENATAVAAAALNSNQHNSTNTDAKMEYKDGMDDDDSESNASDDEEQSVDLLNDDNHDDKVPARNIHGGHSNCCNNASFSLSPISPATQTLDRLSMIGSQDGGAELCVHLSANAVGTPMREDVAKASAQETAAAATATATAVVAATAASAVVAATANSTKKDDGSKVSTLPSQPAATASRASGTTSSTLDIMKGIEPGVDFLPGATLLAKYKGGLSRAQMIKKRGKGHDLEYYIQYIGLEQTEKACWVSVGQLYEIDTQTKKLFRQYGIGEGGLEGKSDLNRRGQQQGGEEESSSIPLTKQRCIRSLKEYFMSTQNSAACAQSKLNSSSGGMELPLVTFCHNCNNQNNNALSQVPHHGLCPKHEDFFVSGSYEILNLIVDGNLLGCNACMHHFENGRPNKQLVHLENCKRYKAKGSRGSSASVGGLSLTQLSTSTTGAKQGGFQSRSTADKAGEGQGGEAEKQGSVINNVNSRDKGGRQDSPELSEYEKLRLRNIQRNEARLAALGLLVPSNKKAATTKKSNNEGFLSRNDSKNDDESKKGKSKGKKKQAEAQKRTQPKRRKQKIGDEDESQPRPASTNKENSSVTNQKQQHGSDVRKDNGNTAVVPAAKAKGKSIESRSSLVEAAKSGCRKCTLEWQTDTKDPSKSHDSSCPRANSSRLANAQQQQKPKGSKKASSRTPPPNSSSIVQKKKASQVTPRVLPALQQSRHIDAAHSMVDNTNDISQIDQRTETDSHLFQHALQKGFSTAFLRGKTEEELLALLSSNRDSQQPVQTILPPFIRDFIAEADHNNEIPAPRGTKWLSCPNPWGEIGHEEGDFVVISPFQSESAADMVSVLHQGPNGSIPKRFVANPLEEGSPYHDTHRSPARKGYSVLRLTRDRMGLRPWGFTVRLHEFGGACLVDNIEPLSPAEAAEDISGWTNKETPSGLQLHDMIICVNGKSVGCMTEAELQLDLDLCGSEMMLVVARFDIKDNTNQDATLEDLAMDWNDIGAGAPSRRKKVVCFEDEESYENSYELKTHSNFNAVMNTSSQGHLEIHDGDDSSFNEEESDKDDDGSDGSGDESSSNWWQRLPSELESKSDEELMNSLKKIGESKKWDPSNAQLAKLLLKRGFLAAATDARFHRLGRDSGGVTRDQAVQWMSRSENFHQYEQIMRAKWSASSFKTYTGEALNAAGYTKISQSRWTLPEDIVPRELQCTNVLSQGYQADEEDPSNWTQRIISELESKSDEELMRQLNDTAESGNWNQKRDSLLAKLLAKRGFLAAAQDEQFQRLRRNSGGVTKDQVIEWMRRSEVFQQFEQIMRAKWSEKTFIKYTLAALKDVGYARISGGGSHVLTRYALPEDNVSSQEAESDEEDSDTRKQEISKIAALVDELESKTNGELMEMLREGINSGELTRSGSVLAQRACLAAAQDENIQQFHNESGGVTKAQIIDWMDKSETFHGYKELVLTKMKEGSFLTKLGPVMASAGYVCFGGGSLTRWALPEDIVPRVDINAKRSALCGLSKSKIDAKKTASSELFGSKTDEELMEMLREGINSGEWTQQSKALAKRACLAAAQDENIQKIHTESGGVTKSQIIDWMDRSETFHGYKELVLTKMKEVSFMTRLSDALISAGYACFGRGTKTRWALPEDVVPRGKRMGIKSSGSTAGKRKREFDTFAKHKKKFNLYSDESSQSCSEEENEEEEDDDNPWLGCVCGRTHPSPIQVFWIQCGACDAWHNVAEDCVGFGEETADTIDEWFCWSCNPPCADLNL
eukprot:scaffold5596_cov132-Skeletonema_dohrnii-CCMP3373.AAC.2